MKYWGNHFQMEREGEYSYYKSFNVSKEQEYLWLNECQNELLTKIEKEDIVSSSFCELSGIIRRIKDFDCFRLLLDNVKEKRKKSDTFSRILLVEELLDIVEVLMKNGNIGDDVIFDAKKLAFDILKDITDEPITIASYYKSIGYLTDILSEEKIEDRIQRLENEFRF